MRRRDDDERDRPLDRRAIEEGRRKREEERARGVRYDEVDKDRDAGKCHTFALYSALILSR